MSIWKIAAVQMGCRFADVPANRAAIRAKFREAAGQGARLVVFPECILSGYGYDSAEEAWPHTEKLPGPTTEALAQDCRELNAWCVFGLLECGGDRFYNACALVGPDGFKASYRKVHLPILGVDRFATPGDRPFAVHDLGGLKLGINICYDGSFPESSRALALQGADLIVLPTNWPTGARGAVLPLTQARAIENHVYYMAVNRTGEERGFRFIGSSRVVDFNGNLIASSPGDQDEILYAEIDPEQAREKQVVIVPGKYEVNRIGHRRPEMYGVICGLPNSSPRSTANGKVENVTPPPNLFDFATSELSQDAFICWLASWADPTHRDLDEKLHTIACKFLDRLFEAGKSSPPGSYESVRVRRQDQNIDVLLVVNGGKVILIEDKINTQDHSGQLQRYREIAQKEFQNSPIAAIYLKTGDQSNYDSATNAGYGLFLRSHFLDILNQGETLGVKNHIFADFHHYLRRMEAAVQSFRTTALEDWDSYQWTGFFMTLQQRLECGDWKYVSNPSGGFMCFGWHQRNGKYLQLENEKLCFKIEVADETQQSAEWIKWNQALLSKNGTANIDIKRTVRRAGKWMTVATLRNDDYRQANPTGQLDLDSTVDLLRRAQLLMDAAV